jgi:hypothetical protein
MAVRQFVNQHSCITDFRSSGFILGLAENGEMTDNVGVVLNSLQDIGRASDEAKRRPVAGGLGALARL